MSKAVLRISSKNYSSWCLRGWLMCRMSGLDFVEETVPAEDPAARAELLLLSPSFLVPSLVHNGIRIWDTMAMGEYLHEIFPAKHLLPKDLAARAQCRSVCGEMHSGFSNLRAALPMNIKARHHDFKIWGGAKADIARIVTIWKDRIAEHGGPYLYGAHPTLADAMYAPVCTRFHTYDVKLDRVCQDYCDLILSMPDMAEWISAAKKEPEALEDLEAEF